MVFNKRILLGISILFTFTAFICVCIATAGTSSNYSPINNVYLGDASIAHINVSKVIPVFSNVLDVLGSALLADGADQEQIFSALKNVSHTSVLLPFLTLLINCENTTTTLDAVMNLTPLVLSSGKGNTKVELEGINSLLASSKDGNATVDYLQDLIGEVAQFNSSSMLTLEDTAFTLLKDSKKPSDTTANLVSLSNLTMAQMAPLLPAFQLLSGSNNVTASFLGLETLMNATIPTALANSLFSSLQTSINNDANLTQVFDKLSALIPSSLNQSSSALEDILVSAQSPNATLGYMTQILDANLTTSDSAKYVMDTISNLYQSSNNKTLLLTSLTGLVSAVGNKNVTTELTTLHGVLKNSNDEAGNVKTLETLQGILTTDTSNNKYIPYLFDILQTSTDPASSFSSLMNVTSFAAANLVEFTPLLGLLKGAAATPKPTDQQLYDIIPTVLDYLKIPLGFRLSIFTLCHLDINGDIIDCSKSHAVQNLDFRSIIYDSLINSDFKPYLDALEISADDLQLQGNLLKKQHMYVPAIKAVLAFNIMFIVVSFGILLFFIYMLVKNNEFALSHWGWFGLLSLSLCCSLFSGLAATIVACMITIIKSGTKKDAFNVVYTTGKAYCGLSWTGFTVTFVTSLIVGVMWLNHWRGAHDGTLPFLKKNGNDDVIVEAAGETSSSASSKVSKNGGVVTSEEKV